MFISVFHSTAKHCAQPPILNTYRLWLPLPPIWKVPPLWTARRVYCTPRLPPSRLVKAGERSMADSAEEELCPNSRSCISCLCRASCSLRSAAASAAMSGGITASTLSSMSSSTDRRSSDGSVWMKVTGSRGWSPWGGCWDNSRRCCSARCWARTWAHKIIMFTQMPNLPILSLCQDSNLCHNVLLKKSLDPLKFFKYSNNKTTLLSPLTSSWMAGGSAARNSGLTSVTPAPPASIGVAAEDNAEDTGVREGGLIPSWFCRTSRRMSSGRAARKDGSTPSGRLMPAGKETNEKSVREQERHGGKDNAQ